MALSTADATQSGLHLLFTSAQIATGFLSASCLLSLGFSLVLGAQEEEGGKSPLVVRLELMGRLLFGLSAFAAVCAAWVSLASSEVPLQESLLLGAGAMVGLVGVLIDMGVRMSSAFVFLVGALMFLVTSLAPFAFPSVTHQVYEGGWLSRIHIICSIFGESMCLVAFAAGLLYLLNYRKLKSKKILQPSLLASLDRLESLIAHLSVVGLGFISLGLVTGILLGLSGAFVGKALTGKVIWAFAVWGWYVLAIFGRGFLGWKGRLAARLSVVGSLLIVGALFGVLWDKFGG